MEDRIREYVDEIFMTAPNTQQAYELKVELTGNLIEKYHTLLAEGKSEQEALDMTIFSIGDINELFASLQSPAYTAPAPPQQSGSTLALSIMMVVGIMLCILSLIPVFLMQDEMGLVIMFSIVAVGVGLIVLSGVLRTQKKAVVSQTVVGDFRDWQQRNENRKRARRAFSSSIWTIVTILYFLVSFSTGKWYITWIIFLIAAALEGIVKAIFALMESK